MKARWYFAWFFWVYACSIIGVCVWGTWAWSHDPGIEGVYLVTDIADGYSITGNHDTVHWPDGMIMVGNLKLSKIFMSGTLVATVPYSKTRVEVMAECADFLTFDVSEGQP